VKRLLLAVGIALVLFAFARHDRDQEVVPTPAPAAEVVSAAPPAVPLSISETTPPAGWVDPATLTPEEQLGAWLAELGSLARGQLFGAAVLLTILAAMVIGLERSRSGGDGGGSYGRSMTIRTEPGHGTKDANIHEAGHWVAAERERARVSLVKVNRDGSGLVRVHGIRSPESRVAIAAAGALAEGSWQWATADSANLEAAVRSVPRDQRDAVRTEGMRRARSHARHGRVRSYAARIGRKGTIRPW
jgi:hypothetical protein